MKVISDLQIHSRFARAVSPQMNIPVINEWAAKKGIGLVATGDWTHPLWFRELQAHLEEKASGLYGLKMLDSSGSRRPSPLFLLSTEISSIYSQGGKVRKVHTLIFAPSFEVVSKINKELTVRGASLLSDGRPIVGLSAKTVAEIALTVDDRCLIIPAHAWTPHFSLYGSVSGFDSIEECFQELSPYIYAIETGLSSDPAMNWRIEELEKRSIVSFSDAHSPQKMGREATVFEITEISYQNVREAIIQPSVFRYQLSDPGQSVNRLTGKQKTEKPETENRIAYTIEFYPEEGKYHYTGHRNCKIVYSPNETRKRGTTCPVCGKPLTVGVMSRIESLANCEIEIETEKDKYGVRWIRDAQGKRVPYVMLVPLLETLSEALGAGVGSDRVGNVYEQLVSTFASEFKVLLETETSEISRIAGGKVAEGIAKVRSGDIVIEPGYDGVFGKVKIWKEDAEPVLAPFAQETLF